MEVCLNKGVIPVKWGSLTADSQRLLVYCSNDFDP